MKLFKIETGNLMLDGGAMFGVVPKSLWNKVYPETADNMCNWAMRCLLFDNGKNVVLVDTGMGNKQTERFFSHYSPNGEATLETSLRKAGYTFEQITDVVLTHLHFDHVGGAVKTDSDGKYKVTFPNAKYYVSKSHWELALNPNRRERASFLKENILPIKESGNLIFIEEEGEHIENIEFLIFNGHTEGQIIPVINFNGKKIAFCGDLFPATAHIPMPYIMAYDTKPLITLQDKERFFDFALKNNLTLFFEHDIFNECCSLKKTDKGIEVDKKFKLEEFIVSAQKLPVI